MPTVRANNIDIYYEESGPADAPVILLVMGLGTQMIAWPEDMIKGWWRRAFASFIMTIAMLACRNAWMERPHPI